MALQKLLVISFVLIGLLGIVKCKSIDKTNKATDLPFTIKEIKYFDWMGGQPGVKGTSLQILVETVNEVKPDAIYFRGTRYQLESKPNKQGAIWIANLTASTQNPDRKMCIEVTDEYGNKPPSVEPSSLGLKNDEALLSYFTKGKQQFYKITKLVKGRTISYF